MTGPTFGERLAEVLEWAADGRPDPLPGLLSSMEPNDRGAVLRGVDELMQAIHEKAEQVAGLSSDGAST